MINQMETAIYQKLLRIGFLKVVAFASIMWTLSSYHVFLACQLALPKNLELKVDSRPIEAIIRSIPFSFFFLFLIITT